MQEKTWDKDIVAEVVARLVKTYDDDRGVNHLEGFPIPNRNLILDCVDDLLFLIFPGFTEAKLVSHDNIEYMAGDMLGTIYRVLSKEIATACHYRCKLRKCDSSGCRNAAEEITASLLKRLPDIREVLKTDVQAAFDGDPAAESFDEIVLAYPGVRAIAMHRIAHELYLNHVPLIPRLISERAHSLTGIDIHPGASIGKSFFIDHGTGVVIGETTTIGVNVKLYMGVTLGALSPAKGQSLRGTKRHPTIEDDVTIYANATILGGETIIGKGSVIGGNVWLTESVLPATRVFVKPPDLVIKTVPLVEKEKLA